MRLCRKSAGDQSRSASAYECKVAEIANEERALTAAVRKRLKMPAPQGGAVGMAGLAKVVR